MCSVVYSDDWEAYRNLNRHQENFVDLATGVHTEEAESVWAQLKIPINERRGLAKEDLQLIRMIGCGRMLLEDVLKDHHLDPYCGTFFKMT